ncbi:DUF2179 domain-containing protein [Ectobacillus ponti]|uniref:UPF0316 protein NK662_20605 n=1 Tax=Ectobacillus ponti TaxID=2961894 RepID=A0AA41XCI8_9BACI|nr:DUF2179 domain-containing protein [Ectobacillus ponti]MCP8970925.1 DUF2179 domain-containing protein [Ectobacillus ponti]
MTTLLLIFCIQVVYVAMLTLRLILIVKGVRYLAACMGAVEIGIYVIGFKLVLDHLDTPVHFIIYCIGYGAGILAGLKLEEKLALGYVTIQINTAVTTGALHEGLRENGYGVTSWPAEGREGLRTIVTVVVKRKYEQRVYELVRSIDPESVIVSYEPKFLLGGFFVK